MQPTEPIVLISGANQGIGRATAIYLARQGCRVFAGSRSMERAAGLVRAAQQHHLPLETVQLDVTDPSSVQAAVDAVLRRAGRIDVLVNNAVIGGQGGVEDFSDDEIWQALDTNIVGPIRLIRAVLPGMRASRSGTIINVSSLQAKISLPFSSLYGGSKWALESISESLRAEVRPFGIRVVVIEPGVTRTRFADNRAIAHRLASGESPYLPWLAAARQKASRLKDRGGNPVAVARAIHRAILNENPPFRVPVGLDAKLGTALRPFIPDRLLFWGVDLLLSRQSTPASTNDSARDR